MLGVRANSGKTLANNSAQEIDSLVAMQVQTSFQALTVLGDQYNRRLFYALLQWIAYGQTRLKLPFFYKYPFFTSEGRYGWFRIGPQVDVHSRGEL